MIQNRELSQRRRLVTEPLDKVSFDAYETELIPVAVVQLRERQASTPNRTRLVSASDYHYINPSVARRKQF